MNQKEFMDSVVDLYQWKMHNSLASYLFELTNIATNGEGDEAQMFEIRGKIMPWLEEHVKKARELKEKIDGKKK